MKLRASSLIAIVLSMSLAACVSDSKLETRGGGTENSAESSGNDEVSGDDNGDSSDDESSEVTDPGTQPGSGEVPGAGIDPGVEPDPVAEPEPIADPDPVADPEPAIPKASVAFVSPDNGASVSNPVTFTLKASNVATVQIEADDWPLAAAPWDPKTQTTLKYTFSGTGFEREVVLYGFDAQGREVAKDTIRMTVKAPVVVDEPPPPPGKGTSLGTFINTYYYVEDENEHGGAANSKFYDRNCNVLATVPESFARLACIEGTAKLKDGRVVNYATATKCGGPCSFTWGVMNANFPWGQGNRANALKPLLSWAVDTNVIANGTVLYVEEWDGKVIPKIGTLGGFTHDGCFRADDVGGGIKGKHVDIFAGSKKMYQELNKTFVTRTSFTVYKNSPRCSHL